MTKLLIVSIATLGLLGTPALAADIAVKAPQPGPAPVPVPSWTGFYLGGSVGARWSNGDWTTTDSDDASLVPASIGVDSTTARVGGYFGYNWQFSSSWLMGLEGDMAWGNGSKSNGGFPGLCVNIGAGPSCTTVDSIAVKEGWDGTIRGRIGFLVTPAWLVYATGGAAWQQVSINAFCNGAPTNNSFCGMVIGQSTSTVRSGWTIGGGVEVMLWDNWVTRAEYRFADFGNIGFTFPPAPFFGFASNVTLKTNTALVGLGYKF